MKELNPSYLVLSRNGCYQTPTLPGKYAALIFAAFRSFLTALLKISIYSIFAGIASALRMWRKRNLLLMWAKTKIIHKVGICGCQVSEKPVEISCKTFIYSLCSTTLPCRDGTRSSRLGSLTLTFEAAYFVLLKNKHTLRQIETGHRFLAADAPSHHGERRSMGFISQVNLGKSQ